MKTSFLILINKMITGVCKLFGYNASVFPGSIVRKFDKNVLDNIKYPKYVVAVTGSSGKGSATSMIAHILEDNRYKVVWNKSGSNVVNGTTTLILNNSGIFNHKVNADVLLLEMDESYIKETFKKDTITHLVLTNITRDQVARNGSPEIVMNKIQNSFDLNTNMEVIYNADDPLIYMLAKPFKNTVSYGINKTKYSLKTPLSNNVDAAYCPYCHSKLIYDFYHYGHIGSYKCPNTGTDHEFERKTDYTATNLDLNKCEMKINGNLVHLNKDVFFAAYYTIAAYALCKEIGLTNEQILHSLNENVLESKRLKSLTFDNRCVEMLESKNENNLSYLQSLNYINNHKEDKTIILGFDNVSRRYKLNDISWIYDIDFEVLDQSKIDKIFCIGRFRYDVYARLILANIDVNKLVLIDNIKDIPKLLKISKGKIFTMVCFDMTAILKKIFMEEE